MSDGKMEKLEKGMVPPKPSSGRPTPQSGVRPPDTSKLRPSTPPKKENK
jgi:hypothetical protein